MDKHARDFGLQDPSPMSWSGPLWRTAGFMLSLLLCAYGVSRAIPLLTILGAASTLFFTLLLLRSILTLNRADRRVEPESVEFLYKLSQTRPSANLASIGAGLRWPAAVVGKHLTSGRLHAVNIYNPQLISGRSLVYPRQNSAQAMSDPRLVWYSSNLDLLPLPDASVAAVFVYRTLSEILQDGDRRALLKEIRRILEPHGRLLVAELADSWTNRLRSAAGKPDVQSYDYWTKLLAEAGFDVQRTQTLNSSMLCIRADKRAPYAGQQMALELEFETY